MPRVMITGFAALALAASMNAQADTVDLLKTEADRISYSIGAQIGGDLKRTEYDMNIDAIAAAIRDTMAGNDMAMTQTEMGEAMQAFQTLMQAKQEEMRLAQMTPEERETFVKQKAEAEKAQAESAAEGIAFLAENAKKEGVVVLPSGLQYKVITAGEGATPTRDDRVETNYRGTLINGEEFDSSYSRGQTTKFGVTQVIPGWTEALLLMKEGAKWELTIPSELAYGDRGAGEKIPGGSTLIFEIELIAVEAQ